MIASWTKFRSLLRRPAEAGDASTKVAAAQPRFDPSVRDRPETARLEPRDDLTAVQKQIADLRDASARQADALVRLHEAQSVVDTRWAEEAAKRDAIDALHRALQERLAEIEMRSRDLHQSLESAESSLRSTRNELLEREARRDREFAGRLAGLYIVGFVALLAALATLVLYLLDHRV